MILLGQEADPGPGRPAAAPGEAPAASTAHAPETARAQAAPTEDAAAAEAAAPATAATTDTTVKEGTAHRTAAARDAATTETTPSDTPATAKAAATKEGTARGTAARDAATETAPSGSAATAEAAATDAAAEDAPAGPATAAAAEDAVGTAATTGAAATGAAAPDTAATEATPAPDRAPQPAPADAGLFARYTRDYVAGHDGHDGHDGHQIMILQAGCTTADGDLGVGVLREAGADIVVNLIDDDQPVTRAALGMDESLAGCVQGDLRTVPLPPRSHDIVLCALLLQRIEHAELVLDRLVAAIRPGGLLLLRFSDRDSSAGFLDRVMPLAARNAVWRKRRPGRPGPYPAVYERLSSARGVQAYALKRELVIAERQALGGLAGALAEPRGFLAAQKLVAWLSRGRLTAAHEELVYVLRKPEDRFARIL